MIVNKIKVKQLIKDVSPVQLVAATKYVGVEELYELEKAGICCFGENRVQALLEKYDQYQGNVPFCMIGTLQKNKVKYIIDKVCMIQSIDSLSLLEVVNKEAKKKELIMPVLIQVNIAKEESKHGFNQEELKELFDQLIEYPNIVVKGFMMMAPNQENVKHYFDQTKALLNKYQLLYPAIPLKELSMGMSQDYQEAIEAGATIIRLGSVLFNEEEEK